MISKIFLNGMKFYANVGHFPEEQRIGIPININSIIWVDTTVAELSDNINDALNYQHIFADIHEIVKNNKFNLIERLSAEIITILLEKYQQIAKIRINISKINPQMSCEIASVGIEMEKSR